MHSAVLFSGELMSVETSFAARRAIHAERKRKEEKKGSGN
jgi:hypothetical protein